MVYCRYFIFWIVKTLYSPGGSFTYSYDAMGNQTSDGRKGLQISYNILNLPCGVTSAISGSLTYTYLSDGTKVSTWAWWCIPFPGVGLPPK
ncbi:MAG: hypothetical protein J5886_00800 [Bacteroidales bacterium]|nr:hypothetical protein [Bacteroidales bacterium]